MNKAHLVLGIIGTTALGISIWSVVNRTLEIRILNDLHVLMTNMDMEYAFGKMVEKYEEGE